MPDSLPNDTPATPSALPAVAGFDYRGLHSGIGRAPWLLEDGASHLMKGFNP